MANRLSGEKSPYLLQHADNPVDWYPWGEEAFAKARREAKPVFLSIGYSTCHWCHVMERESFADPATARALNESFVSIKVDREERPDVDKVYMTAVQAMTGHGGWPLSAFLTPDLEPFFGGTYFPPEPRWGQPAFRDLLARVAELWRERRAEIEADAGRLAEAVRGWAAGGAKAAAIDEAVFERALAAFRGSFDPENAGFGGAPKFPMPVNLEFLLALAERWRRRRPKEAAEALEMARRTLLAIAAGGISDQVGGGFHRYSTDAAWRVPHFEKMLYDNAQLAAVFVEAWRQTRLPAFERAARRALDYLLRDLAAPEGAFYSAEDADSAPPEGGEKAEGAFYLWTAGEFEKILGAQAPAFARAWGVGERGNAPSDPHGEFAGKNILHEAEAGDPPGGWDAVLARLLEIRAQRPRPLRDDKILASWNGLALSALARAALVLDDRRYRQAAERAADFLHKALYEEGSGRLWRRWRAGDRAVPGTADDYAFLARGALDLYEACYEPRWLEWSCALAAQALRRFAAETGGFFMTEEGADPRLLSRVIEDSDNVEPSASAVMAEVLLRLASYTGREEWRAAASSAIERFGQALGERPLSMGAMLSAALLRDAPPPEIAVVGSLDDPRTRRLLAVARERAPRAAVVAVDESRRERLKALAPDLAALPAGPEPAAYVCVGRACQAPTSDVGELESALEAR